MASVHTRRAEAAGRPLSSAAARLAHPVISVGNIAMGGRGKTPLVAWIAGELIRAGERPAILSRGYGRRIHDDAPVIVSDGDHIVADLDRAGDEPLLLARTVPQAIVVVCGQRALAGAVAESRLGATVHILDDGFQHRGLARDIDIVAIAPQDMRGRRVPFGTLREPASALRRADAVIVDGDAGTVDVSGGRPVFGLTRTLGAPVALEPERQAVEVAAGVIAVAGIADPSRFVTALEAQGVRVAYVIGYRDHHRYTARDIDHIAASVRRWNAGGVLTTEKDAVRLLPFRPLPFAAAAVPLQVGVGDEFREWLLARLREVRR